MSPPGLAWKACLKKTGIKLELLSDINMLLIVGEGINGGICQAIQIYANTEICKVNLTATSRFIHNFLVQLRFHSC